MRRFGSLLLVAAVLCVLALALGRRGNEVERAEFEAERAARQALEREVERLRAGLEETATAPAPVATPAGFVPYTRELPEPISAASTPALEALDEALRRGLVAVGDLPLLDRLEREAQAYARRLVEDRLFRLGEQTRSHVLTSLRDLGKLEAETLWSPPFLLVATEGRARRAPPEVERLPYAEWPSLAEIAERRPRYGALLAGTAEVLQAVYRDALARFGEPLGLRPLEDPFGGRPDLRVGVRSFEDGFPIPVVIWATPDAPRLPEAPSDGGVRARLYETLVRRAEASARGVRDGVLELWAGDDRLGRDSVPPSRAALGAGSVLLDAFQRQRSAWRLPRHAYDAARTGLTALLGSFERDATGRVVRNVLAPILGEGFATQRALRAMAASMGRDAPWIPLAELLAMDRASAAEEWAVRARLGPGSGAAVYGSQSWALVRYLEQRPGGATVLEALLSARLDGPLDPAGWRRLLKLRDEDEWEALDAAFRAWFEEVLLASVPAASPGPR